MFDAAEVRTLLANLREADTRTRVFGSRSHRYALGPPVPEATLGAWERQHGIELPADYRAFLLELGNGGAGPF